VQDVLSRPAPGPDETLRYGPGPDQVASVWWPRPGAAGATGATGAAGLVLFLHGGFWRAAWDRTHAGPLAVGLAEAGFTVCLPEYRRTGGGGGWPATFDDIAAAVDTLPGLFGDSSGVVLAGHSAGGHLSLWAAARHRLPAGTPWRTTGPAPIRGVVALAAVSDLTACAEEGLGGGAAAALMGGSPAAEPDRYARADPARLLPIGVPVWLLHGDRDDRVPAPMSRSFAARPRAAGDQVTARELPECDHFDLIDPRSAAWPAVRDAFRAAGQLPGRSSSLAP
jgi:acetyl esterase/lipase